MDRSKLATGIVTGTSIICDRKGVITGSVTWQDVNDGVIEFKHLEMTCIGTTAVIDKMQFHYFMVASDNSVSFSGTEWHKLDKSHEQTLYDLMVLFYTSNYKQSKLAGE